MLPWPPFFPNLQQLTMLSNLRIFFHNIYSQANSEHAKTLRTLQTRFQNLTVMFQNLNSSVQNMSKVQNQIGRVADEANFGVKQLATQLTNARDTKVNYFSYCW